MMLRHILITGIAALFLTTGIAHADATKEWQSGRLCTVWKQFVSDADDPLPNNIDTTRWQKNPGSLRTFGGQNEVSISEAGVTVTLQLHDVLELQKYLPMLKKCTAFWKCVEDREAGKVKHCYENDRRWR
jgi:hypothetical protein